MMLVMKMATCHPDKPHTAFGMCSNCYYKDRYKKYPELLKKRNATPAARARKHKWYKKQLPGYAISNHLQHRYGITQADYDLMLHKQDNKCKICLKEFTKEKRPNIDHNHKTGQVRALLCPACNTGLGMVRESEFNLARMIAYLRWSESISMPEFEAWALADFVDLRVVNSQSSTDEQPSLSEQS